MIKTSKHVLIIGFVWPEPSSSAAGRRMMQLVAFFRYLGWDITFASTAKKTQFSADLSALGVTCELIKVNDAGFDAFVSQINPDVVLFDRFMTEEQFGWRVYAQCPTTLRILDTEDLHLLRYAREKSFKAKDDRIQKYLTSDLAKREIASIYRCDLSLIISESEIHLLRDFFKVPQEVLLYLPYMIDPVTDDDSTQWPGFSKRKGFMTIGNFRHKPNLDSIDYLRTKIWPLIRKSLPNAIMNVYGAYPRQQMEEWNQPSDGFLIHGRADDADAEMQKSRVCLAPLRFGAGLKGKLIEAMLNGTPSITTSMGAEGIHGTMDWPGIIADDVTSFAAAAVQIYSDSSMWSEAQKRGITIINERFSKQKLSSIFEKRLSTIENELELHRSNNFTGQMLMHHTMASTRFMSRWIEEKNRE